MAHISRIDPNDRARLQEYAAMIRQATIEDFGPLAQVRTDESFSALFDSADGKIEWYTMSVSLENPEIIGGIEIVMLDEHRASVFVRVLKALQGYGFGQQGLAFAIERARVLGASTVLGSCSARSRRDNRNVRFLLKSGFEELSLLLRQDVPLDTDPSAWEVPTPDGLEIATMTGSFDPDVMAAVFALSHEVIVEEPTLTSPSSLASDAEALVNLYTRMEEGGKHTVIAYAREASGTVVGYTEAQLSDGDKIAEQYLTYVLPSHRRLGVSKALKAAALKEIKRISHDTEAMRVFLPAEYTWSAQTNRQLGYTDTAYYREWTLPLS